MSEGRRFRFSCLPSLQAAWMPKPMMPGLLRPAPGNRTAPERQRQKIRKRPGASGTTGKSCFVPVVGEGEARVHHIPQKLNRRLAPRPTCLQVPEAEAAVAGLFEEAEAGPRAG